MLSNSCRRASAGIFLFAICFLAAPYKALAAAAGLLSQTDPSTLRLASEREWRALLHAPDGVPRIRDPAFLLSLPNFSPEAELIATLQAFSLDDRDAGSNARLRAVCRFPARYEWLARRIEAIRSDSNPVKDCGEIGEFFNRAPADDISLVYASENLVSASSMMGHVLLELSGTNTDGNHTEHAISFFTSVTGRNFLWSAAASLTTGTQGFYALSPYREHEAEYLQREQRSVWIYRVKLDPEERRRVQLHLYELRHAALTYFFDIHNCATFTADILAVADPAMSENTAPWMSPLDVIKNAKRLGRIDQYRLVPTTQWAVRMYESQLSRQRRQQIVRALSRGESITFPADIALREQLLELLYEEALLKRLSDGVGTDLPTAATQLTAVQAQIEPLIQAANIDITQYKNPSATPQDAQWEVGTAYRGSSDAAMSLRLLPAGRRLLDDQRQSFSTSELRIGETTLSTSLKTGAVFVDEFALYSVTSLLPLNSLGEGISWRFSAGYRNQFWRSDERTAFLGFNGGIGSTITLADNIDAFALMGAAVGFRDSNPSAYPDLEIGLIGKWPGANKTILLHRVAADCCENLSAIQSVTIKHLSPITQSLALVFDAKREWSSVNSEVTLYLGIRHYF